MDAVLVVDKPEGPTSHDVVAVARRALGSRQVGHAGTLDPMATGALVLMIGAATRLARFFAELPKTYEACLELGTETDSGDRSGRPVAHAPAGTPWPALPAVHDALARLQGTLDQLPPALSAKRVGGSRAYALARAGVDVAVRPASVTLHDASVSAYDPPRLDLTLRCSAGFYVRSLARDLGRVLGCGAHLRALRRTACSGFAIDAAVPLDLLASEPAAAAQHLVPLDALLPHLPSVTLTASGSRKAKHGNDLGPGDLEGSPIAYSPGQSVRLLEPDGTLVAIGRPRASPAVLHPAVVLR